MIPPMLGIIGAANASEREWCEAYDAGRLAAKRGWILVCGGLSGVMEAASKGAFERGGTIVGILPFGDSKQANKYVTIPIATNMGHARNVIIAHTAEMLIAVGGSEGTLSEIAISRKLGKPVFAIGSWDIAGTVEVSSAPEAIEMCQKYLDEKIPKEV
jgi:hypothetical protein